MNSETSTVRMIREICAEEEIDVESFSYDWVFKLTKSGKTQFIIGYNFNLNPSAAKAICDDKAAASEIMKSYGIPCVEHEFFMAPEVAGFITKDGSWARLMALLQKYGGRMVCKDNKGHAGKLVFLAQSQAELETCAQEIFSKVDQMAVCPFEEIESEHRLIMLDAKPLLVFRKERAEGEWHHNLSLGARGVLEQNAETLAKLTDLARVVMNKLNMHFASVDIIRTAAGLKVMEVNSGVSIEHFAGQSAEYYALAKIAYRAAILAMFVI